MKLDFLLKNIEIKQSFNTDDSEISGLSYDSRKTKAGHLFVAIDGVDDDGHKYIESAVKNGARVIVVEKHFDKFKQQYPKLSIIEVEDARIVLAELSNIYFDNITEKFHMTGITGTKGKSTISYMYKSIMDIAGKDCAVIGTLGVEYGDKHIETAVTTPSSYDLNEILSQAYTENVHCCIMEVSSIALKMHRVYGINYDIGMFTNFSRAHITKREHSDMNDYLESKKMLFNQSKVMLVNIDDKSIKEIVDGYKNNQSKCACQIITIGLDKDADISASNIQYVDDGSSFVFTGLGHTFSLQVDMPGIFNIYNSLFAAAACLLNKVAVEHIQKGLSSVLVKGRCEKLPIDKEYTIMIDYAHTPDSLEKLLQSVRETKKEGRIISVFGTGGDRDNAMRPMMGRISGENADFSILTSDNSRTENPDSIIDMIEQGIKQTSGEYVRITDRTEAIRYAMNIAQKDDIIILAGKGHETYFDVMGVKTHYDEREVVQNILKGIL